MWRVKKKTTASYLAKGRVEWQLHYKPEFPLKHSHHFSGVGVYLGWARMTPNHKYWEIQSVRGCLLRKRRQELMGQEGKIPAASQLNVFLWFQFLTRVLLTTVASGSKRLMEGQLRPGTVNFSGPSPSNRSLPQVMLPKTSQNRRKEFQTVSTKNSKRNEHRPCAFMMVWEWKTISKSYFSAVLPYRMRELDKSTADKLSQWMCKQGAGEQKRHGTLTCPLDVLMSPVGTELLASLESKQTWRFFFFNPL